MDGVRLNACGNLAALYPAAYVTAAAPLRVSSTTVNGGGFPLAGSFFILDAEQVSVNKLSASGSAADGLDLAGVTGATVANSTFSKNAADGVALQNADTGAHLAMNGVALQNVRAAGNGVLGFGFGAPGDPATVGNLSCTACTALDNGALATSPAFAAGFLVANGSTTISASFANDSRSGAARTQTYGLSQL